MSADNETVELKSHNSNFILNIFTDDYKKAIDNIKQKFEKDSLLKDINVINSINAEYLGITDIQMIKDFLKKELNIDYKEKKIIKKNTKEPKKEILKEKIPKVVKSDILEDDNYKTKIIKSPLRSGASVSYDGNILVIGDVNAGAELIASGSIIVLGVLRGFANAGAKGDKNAMVIANKIVATQLRIAEFIAIPPKDDKKSYSGVQMALIKEKEIEIQQIN